jgi:hypothetical protein
MSKTSPILFVTGGSSSITMMLLQQIIQNHAVAQLVQPYSKDKTSRVSSSHSQVYVYRKNNSFGAKALLIIIIIINTLNYCRNLKILS